MGELLGVLEGAGETKQALALFASGLDVAGTQVSGAADPVLVHCDKNEYKLKSQLSISKGKSPLQRNDPKVGAITLLLHRRLRNLLQLLHHPESTQKLPFLHIIAA